MEAGRFSREGSTREFHEGIPRGMRQGQSGWLPLAARQSAAHTTYGVHTLVFMFIKPADQDGASAGPAVAAGTPSRHAQRCSTDTAARRDLGGRGPGTWKRHHPLAPSGERSTATARLHKSAKQSASAWRVWAIQVRTKGARSGISSLPAVLVRCTRAGAGMQRSGKPGKAHLAVSRERAAALFVGPCSWGILCMFRGSTGRVRPE